MLLIHAAALNKNHPWPLFKQEGDALNMLIFVIDT